MNAASQASEACFHCGLPLPTKIDYRVTIEGKERPMCCPGCAAVAETIIGAGLTDYYRDRETFSPKPDEELVGLPNELAAYDLPELQNTFVHRTENTAEAALMLEGIRCAACVWLIERHLKQLPGALEANINYATRRMRIRWDTEQIKLSRILEAIAKIGYRASPFDPAKAETARRLERRQAIKRLALAALGMMQVMMLAVPVYLAPDGDIEPDHLQLLHWASLLITAPVLLISAREFFVGAWRGIVNRRLGMDVPIALGISAAFAASTWNTITARGEVFFDSATMFVFLLLTARFLEQEARARSGDALERLTGVLPEHCQRFDEYPTSRSTHTVASAWLNNGDYLFIGTGERFPADGIVVEGTSETDESLVTGESRPVAKHEDDEIIAGSINVGSPLVIRATAVGMQNTVAQITRLLDRALGEKPQIAQLADRAASWFVIGLLIVTAFTAIYWWQTDPARMLPIVIALLVITCPCALGLATPAALTTAAHRLVRMGLLPSRGHAIETLAQVTDIVFDKTGTLTLGTPAIAQVTLLGKVNEAEVIAIASGLEASSKHPLGKTLRAAAAQPREAIELTTYPGAGIQGTIDKTIYRIGTLAFVRDLVCTDPPAEPQTDASCTVVALGNEQGWLAFFHFTDMLRPESREVVAALQAMNKTVHILSGDSPGMVSHIAAEAGITHNNGGATPEQKLDYIRALQAKGAVVAMVGDGINDAPSLGGAEVSIAMGSGTDIAQSAADMVLISGNLGIIPPALKVAKTTRSVIRQNLRWALAYNLVAIPLAALGLVTPWVASVGMSLSSLIVVANALRLARSNKNSTVERVKK
ncbi:MAG: heavy metal translocating P-type ATPase [Pseudomonadota bacterium]